VRGRAGVLEAAALVDGDVHQHRAGSHPADQLVGHQPGRLGAGDQDRPDDEVGLQDGPLDLQDVGGDRLAVTLVDQVRLAELVDVRVQQEHLGLHAERDGGRVHAGDARADHHHLGRVHAGDAAHQDAPAALRAHQVIGADLGREPARDLGHGREQGEAAVGRLHGLVGDAGDPRVEHRPGARLRGGQVQVGEEHLPLAHPVVLLGDRLLDLEDQVAIGPDRVRVGQDGRARRGEVGVRDGGAETRLPLDEDLVTVAHQLVRARRGERHPVFAVLDLSGNSDLHGPTPFPLNCGITGILSPFSLS
jgi:hypothetical protein